MKTLVIAMGFTMIIGVIFLLGMIYKTIDLGKRDHCNSSHFDLPKGAAIQQITPSKKDALLYLLIQHPDKAQTILMFDSCSGKTVRQFTSNPVDHDEWLQSK
jgi:hypothetical protein